MNTQTITEFEAYVDMQIRIGDLTGVDKWVMYEFLKRKIKKFNIEHDEAIRIITKKLEI